MNEEHDPVETLIRLAGRRPGVDAERTARVRAAVDAEWRATSTRRRRTRIVASIAVAAGLGAVVAGVMLVRTQSQTAVPQIAPIVARVQSVHGTSDLTPGQVLRAGAQLNLHANAFASLEWNGAALRLDSETALRLDGAGEATLQRGAVYYSGHGGGITLHTTFGDVRDIGTRFEARLLVDAVRVRVREGAVELRGRTARAGYEIVATRAATSEHAVPTSGEEWSWIERAAPPLLLEGKPLEDVLRVIAEEKGLTLVWNGRPDARRMLLHGDTPLSVSEALDAATTAAGVQYRVEGDRLLVGGRS